MRLLFTMFAEASGLIPEKSFINLLKNQRAAPQHLEHQLAALGAAMDAGDFSPAPRVPLRTFNGYLFKDCTAILLDAEETGAASCRVRGCHAGCLTGGTGN